MKPSEDFILSQLQRGFVADSPEQQKRFIQQTVLRMQRKSRQRMWVLGICSVVAILSLLLFFPLEPLVQVLSSQTLVAGISRSTLLLATLPVVVVGYVMILIENTR
ncbi:hypothetical protein [Thalassotalea mangrovi]|uniref:Uncharacterized protein n=1 Tax=Thalassotalea mangrovi TaxID=2572245 RepID=A0A4U1BB20_9GAMM|nr:hypothetical protein [Thalassotalea mangrovi]TKB47368.1 hypothetical protein E8M12_00840 [Thalassotalea mangrovi]